ncbi:hypothetical protein C1645_789462 [Glomus cerebriforme]|uniref:Uncharacterized protein n=1 Tax=Glomus cerebriforme TaxID=658196 RepID=A0A397SGF4_9GLOM|nr:hypothetical protein C1645_789462 [Glomus cerebriforme]
MYRTNMYRNRNCDNYKTCYNWMIYFVLVTLKWLVITFQCHISLTSYSSAFALHIPY